MSDLEIAIEGLKEGILIEERGVDFYTKASKELADPNGRNTLIFLAKEEMLHKKVFEDFLSGFALTEGAKDLIDAGIKILEEPRIFPEKIEFSGTTSKDNDVIRQAKELEKRSIEFYSGLHDKVTGHTYRKLFTTLIKVEESHLTWLEYMEDSINLNGYWSNFQDYFANE